MNEQDVILLLTLGGLSSLSAKGAVATSNDIGRQAVDVALAAFYRLGELGYKWEPPAQGVAAPPDDQAQNYHPTLQVGSKGPYVKEWQAIVLVNQDGDFGGQTETATQVWQNAHQIPPTGIVDDLSWKTALGEKNG